ncbi:SAV_6107 family HEPN domain-containing protein [Actinoplanes sp. NPDC051513]|uniref:SAV_6107 family HEPN domain-containing protein n=1 Tax=Actinoplanes sp. NPDC051513 TaxID=3363908 RepID=UPI0037A20ED0
MLPHRTPAQLLVIARQGLADARETRSDGMRYAGAHLAALRAAAAVLGARAKPDPERRRRPTVSVWVLLAEVAPEFGDWATYFAGTSTKRAAAEAGIPRTVTAQEADDLLDAAGQFVDVVSSSLGFGEAS